MDWHTLMGVKLAGIKLGVMLSGLGGGIVINAVYIPKHIIERGLFLAGVSIAFSSIIVSSIFTELLMDFLDINEKYTMAIAFTLGGMSLSFVNWITNWLRKKDNMDILEVADEVSHRRRRSDYPDLYIDPHIDGAAMADEITHYRRRSIDLPPRGGLSTEEN